MYQKPKGTRDILPAVMHRWHRMEEEARKHAARFGYREIRTPTFEETALFTRSVGESSDIVSKEMYTFEDKGGRSLTLRPEGTAGAVRAFVENGLFNEPLPQKLFYLTNNFRYENPQAGRYREHTQFGAECLGIASPLAELESLDLATSILKGLGIDIRLVINSIGCPECRKNYNQVLAEYAGKHHDELCEDCKRRLKTNPLRMLDCKNEKCHQLWEKAPKLTEYLCPECKIHFEEVQKLLKANKIDFTVDSFLVRGFDYYTKTVFEFQASLDGKTLAFGGGGRYDNLVEELGGKPTACVGFGLGLDRLVLLLPEIKPNGLDACIINAGEIKAEQTYPLVRTLREQGLAVEGNLAERSFKAQLKYADKLCAKYIIIIGDAESAGGFYTLKDLRTGQESKVSQEKLVKILKEI